MRISVLTALVFAGLSTGAAYSQTSYTNPPTQPTPAASTDQPTVLAMSPKMPGEGAQVIITGRNLENVKDVDFAGQKAEFTVVNDSEIKAIVPVGGAADMVEITTSSGAVTATDQLLDSGYH